MSQWETRVKEHPVWTTLDSIGPLIDSCLSIQSIEPETIAGLERIRLVLTAVGRKLASTDPLLISIGQLNGLNSPLERVISELNAYLSNNNSGHIINANSYLDECLNYLGQIVGTITSEDLSILSASASNFRTTINRYLKELTKTLNDLNDSAAKTKAKTDELELTLKDEQQRLAAALIELQTQFANTQNQRSVEFTSALNDATTKLSTELDTQRAELSKLQNEKENQLNSLINQFKSQNEGNQKQIAENALKLKNSFKNQLEQLKKDYSEEAQLILNDVKYQKARVEKLVGIIGNIGVSSGFLKVANYSRLAGWVWQIITVLSFIGLISVSYLVAFPKQSTSSATVSMTIPEAKLESGKVQSSPNEQARTVALKETKVATESNSKFIQGFLSKLFLSITFGIFAAYSARQARRFFEVEQQNRQKALELEALGPFIEPLEKADQDKFRVQVGDRSFGVPDSFSKDAKDNDPTSLLSIVKDNNFVDGCTKIIKAFKGET